jgi:hypothetical protein
MPQVGFEPTIPAFKRAKTVHALYRAVAVIDKLGYYRVIFLMELKKIIKKRLRIVCVPAGIRTQHVSNTGQKRNRSSSFASTVKPALNGPFIKRNLY